MNKRQLYETIMRKVSRIVKSTLNEEAQTSEDFYVCTAAEASAIKSQASNFVSRADIADNDTIVSLQGDDMPFVLNGEHGNILGDIEFYAYYDGDGIGLGLYGYDLYFESNGKRARVYLYVNDMLKK